MNPNTLLAQLKKAKNQVPSLVREELENSNLERLNINNLQQGKDSDGNDMPRYLDPDYANFKLMMNPSNRGFWDLRLSGEYYRGIKANIYGTQIFFRQTITNKKIEWIHSKIGLRGLGITDKQLYEVQLKNKPKIKRRLENIINNV